MNKIVLLVELVNIEMILEKCWVVVNDMIKSVLVFIMLLLCFYIIDFDEMDKIDVELVCGEWDVLIFQMCSDFNRGYFKCNDEWEDIDIEVLLDELWEEFIDFFVLFLMLEFFGCVFYKEMKWCGKN